MGDRWTERAVVVMLGVFALVGLGGLIWLIDHGSVTDAALLAIIAGPTGTALGSLGTLLARLGGDRPAEVQVVNTPLDPVPVAEGDN